MVTLKTKEDIEEFANVITRSGFTRPRNLDLVITLEKEDYNTLVPEDFRVLAELEYNSPTGMRFKLISE